jgi:AcrR family transcriptional regulator
LDQFLWRYRARVVTPGPPLGFSPRQARGVAARARVYEEALRQFAEKGFETTRVEDVVSAAGVAWGTFFRYFPRKEDVLLEAAVHHHREHVVPTVDAGLESGEQSARSVALDLFLAMLSPAAHPPRLHGEIVSEVIESRERFTAMLGEDQPFVVLVARVVEYGQRRGEVRTDLDALTLAGVLAAGTLFPTIYGYYYVLRGLRSLDTTDGPATLVERAFGVVWRGLEPIPELAEAEAATA